MNKLVLAILFLFLGSTVMAQSKLVKKVDAKKGDLVIPFTEYKLSNGLTVLLHEDHSDPIVHVDVTYHVGSAREEIGKSGFAHFFEHMMFQGSDNVADEQHFKIITEAGGTLNGTTNRDRTNYFETVPSNQLEKMLWLEADRMGFLLDAVTQKKFEVQRATVKNERGQNYDNRPYGLAGEVASKHIYPYGHPYSWLTIGYIEDLDRVNVQDLKNFFLRWYGPNNAVITVGGDIDPKQTLAWIEKYFGGIPMGPSVEPVKLAPPVVDADRYVTLIDNYAKIPLLSLSFPTVGNYHPDEAPLDCLAEILGGSKSSPLYQKLVKTQKALMARASNPCSELAGEFSISVMPRPGTSLAEMEKEIRAVIAAVAEEGFKEEDVRRFNQSQEASMIYRLESVSGKVSQLASYYTFTGDADYIKKDLQRYINVTKEDVLRVFNKYVKDKPMVILSVLPKGQDSLQAAVPNHEVDASSYQRPNYGYDNLKYVKAKDVFDRSKVPNAAAAISVKVPAVEKNIENIGTKTVKMISSKSDEIPMVVVMISMKGGRMVEQNDLSKVGVSSLFASMMNEDTKKYKAEQIADMLDEMGSSVSVSTSFDEINFTVRSLTKNLDKTLEILRERIYNPVFEEATFNRLKNQTLEGIKNSKTRASTVVSDAYDRVNYGKNSILGYSSSGTEETVGRINLNDIQNYYNTYVAANNLKVVMVGDYTNKDKTNVMGVLNGLEPKDIQIAEIPKVAHMDNNKIVYVVNIPKAAQTEFRIGYVTDLTYDATGEYYKSNLMNYALGGAFNSRLNLNLREDKGWTYGARAGFRGDDYTGSYTFSSGIKADATVDALKEIITEFEGYRSEGITKDELSFMKNAISQSDARKYETGFQKAGFLGNMLDHDLEVTYVDEQNAILKKISPKEINELANKWVNTSKMQIVLAGDAEKIREGIEKLGYKVVEIDAEGNMKN